MNSEHSNKPPLLVAGKRTEFVAVGASEIDEYQYEGIVGFSQIFVPKDYVFGTGGWVREYYFESLETMTMFIMKNQ